MYIQTTSDEYCRIIFEDEDFVESEPLECINGEYKWSGNPISVHRDDVVFYYDDLQGFLEAQGLHEVDGKFVDDDSDYVPTDDEPSSEDESLEEEENN